MKEETLQLTTEIQKIKEDMDNYMHAADLFLKTL